MTKTARRKQRKLQRKVQQSQRNAKRNPPNSINSIDSLDILNTVDPFDLSGADIQRAAESQRNATHPNAQRRGQHKAPVIGGKPDYSETLHHHSPPRHAPPTRDPGRCGPVAYDILYFEAWRAFFKADIAQYKPRHYLGISPNGMEKSFRLVIYNVQQETPGDESAQ